MPIDESLLKTLKCCISKDEHIVLDPVLVTECNSSACKQCILDSKVENVYCYGCKSKHEKTKLLNAPANIFVENLIKNSSNELFEYVDEKLNDSFKNQNKDSKESQLKDIIDEIENQIDLRYESFVDSLETYRNECKSKLFNFKEDFEKNIEQKEDSTSLNTDSKEKSLELFKEIQIKMKVNQNELEKFKENLKKVQFRTSDFNLEMSQFGSVGFLFCDSLILNHNEQLNLMYMTKSKSSELVFRATRDGFNFSTSWPLLKIHPNSVHSKCENKPHLVSIIRNNYDYVFGAYNSFAWGENLRWATDPNAFIFSLRRNGETKNDKFMINNSGQDKMDYYFHDMMLMERYCGPYASLRQDYYIRYGEDIVIKDESNKFVGSYCNFGSFYQLPDGMTYDTDDSRSFLAGNYDQWLTTEIEVYQIKFD